MGLKLFSASSLGGDRSSCNPPVPSPSLVTGNPDPANYDILRSEQIGSHLVLEIQYPDCHNYEGRKILVFESTTLAQLQSQKYIDPHFSDSVQYRHPVARFEPTPRGWNMALLVAKAL